MMKDRNPKVAVIGPGALGTVLARRLAERGYPVEAVFSRQERRARWLAASVDAPVASSSLDDLPADVALVFCCVPDDVIGDVARVLCRVRPDWTGCTVAHTAGALTAAALYGLGEQGAALLSFHPLQTFTLASTSDVFEDIYIGLEGDDAALALGVQVAKDLGARPLVLAPEAKIRYHLAASMASNYLVTLMALVNEVFASAGIDHRRGTALVQPLIDATWRNLTLRRPEDVLTGPIVRGDSTTISHHTEALAEHLPHLIPAYAVLGAETVRVAVRSGRLSPDDAQRILDLLHAVLEPYKDFP